MRTREQQGERGLELAAKSQEETITARGGYSKWGGTMVAMDSRFSVTRRKKHKQTKKSHERTEKQRRTPGTPGKERAREERERVFLAVTHCC